MSIPPDWMPVVQITAPVVLAIFIAVWVQNRSFDLLGKRIDDANKRIDDTNQSIGKRIDELNKTVSDGFAGVNGRLDSIDASLKEHGERIARLEGRMPPPLVRN